MKKQIERRSVSAACCDWPESLHPLLQRVYQSRDIADTRQLQLELSCLFSPDQLSGIERAVERLLQAFEQQQKVVIVGDFDADGATSTTLALLALQALGLANTGFLIPNRFDYGYGLTPEIVALALQQKPALIITVDNGISSIDGVAAANAKGVDVIVTDHHLPGKELPAAVAIVNPNQPDCAFPSKNLAGVGVIFYLMSALRSALRERQWFQKKGIAEPNMAQYLDLVALGTVADVVPLDHSNRVLVHQGLKRIRAGKARPGILALLQVSKRKRERVVASDLGFAVGPRLNAAGRLDDMTHGVSCLLCNDPALALEMATELDELNRDRRQIEQAMQLEALKIVDELHLDSGGVMHARSLCLYDPRWHQGVIGILASRIKERFHRPVIAFANSDTEGELKGSARSISGVHIRDILDAVAAHHPGMLNKFGGHAMAAGLTLAADRLEDFQKAFEQEIVAATEESFFRPVLLSDGELKADEFNLFLAELIRNAGPWGQMFPEPVFDGIFYLVQQRLVGDKHLKMVLSLDEDHRQIIDAIAFNVDLSQWPNQQADRVQIAYRLDINEYRQQQSLQLIVEYLALFS
jgi:single-stranded-DNA-specific exonuclease